MEKISLRAFYLIISLLLILSLINAQNYEEDELEINNVKISGIKGSQISSENGNTKIVLTPPQEITITNQQKDSVQYGDFIGEAEFTFNKDGELIKANFKSNNEKTYDFGDFSGVHITAYSNVHFDSNAKWVGVGVPNKAKIKNPEGIPEGGRINYITTDDGFMTLDDETESGVKFEGELYFNSLGSYIQDEAKIGDIEIPKVKKIDDEKPGMFYFDFKGELNKNYDDAYVSMNPNTKDFVIATNGEENSQRVVFNKGNPYLFIEENDHTTLQVFGHEHGSYVKFNGNSNNGFVPNGETFNYFEMEQNGVIYSYNKESKKTEDGSRPLLLRFADDSFKEKSTSPLLLDLFVSNPDGQKKNLLKEDDLFLVDNYGGSAYGTSEQLKEGVDMSSRHTYTGTDIRPVVTSRLTYNYANAEIIEKTFGVKMTEKQDTKLSRQDYRMFYDVFSNLPEDLREGLNGIQILPSNEMQSNVEIDGAKAPYARARAFSNGIVDFNYGVFSGDITSSSKSSASTLIHELGHVYLFSLASEGDVNGYKSKLMKSLLANFPEDHHPDNKLPFTDINAPPQNGYPSGYAHYVGTALKNRKHELFAELFEVAYNADLAAELYQADPIMRKHFATLDEHGVITEVRYNRIKSLAGFDDS